jgi:hypothetical protein
VVNLNEQPDDEAPALCYMCNEPMVEQGFLIPIGQGSRVVCHPHCWDPNKGEQEQ